MPCGYNGRILRVNLSSEELNIEEPSENLYRQYFGGEGFVGYYLLKELAADVEPFSPDNKLIFAAGVLTGVPVGGCGRHSVGSKSPLTGGFGEAEAGGYWGSELKMAGFDAIIVEGKAEKPVYLLIIDSKAEIRDAHHLWGLKTLECQDAIRNELADSTIKVAQIGPAGENLVRFATVSNDLDAFAGRTGMGAVMGSKNLKAIACRGHKRISVADTDTVRDIGRWVRNKTPVAVQMFRDFGTASVIPSLNKAGGLPTRNFQLGYMDTANEISGQTMTETILVKRLSCFACPIQCKRMVKFEGPFAVNPRYGGPEYETIAALGSNCGIDDLKIIAKGNEIAAAYGIDTISCGMAIAFAMNCYEHGLLTKQDTGGLDLCFGNGPAMLKMMEQIALRESLGDLLAEGVAQASKEIGVDAEEFALHVKGQELPMHEPRWKQGLGIGFAVSPTGADHCHNMHDHNFTAPSPLMKEMQALGIVNPLPANDLSPAKIRLLIYNSLWVHFLNCAVCCYFVMLYGLVGFSRLVRLVSSVTGWETGSFELMKVGERAVNLAQCFNLREGFTNKDDTLPQRFFTPQTEGPLQGIALDPREFRNAVNMYYEMMGWSSEGVPTTGKLGELGIEWVVPQIRSK
ncbi:aldehyde ferredoxin oxidoreductase family protein [Chloroflexota bacterium]